MQAESAGMRAHTFFTSQREKGRERERERESVCERKWERDVEYCAELLFLFLKGMTGALAPFSYLVCNILISIPTNFLKGMTIEIEE